MYIQNIKCSLLFHCNNVCTNAPQCYVIRTLPDLLGNVLHQVVLLLFSCILTLSETQSKPNNVDDPFILIKAVPLCVVIM
jgi:hypothetical protein